MIVQENLKKENVKKAGGDVVKVGKDYFKSKKEGQAQMANTGNQVITRPTEVQSKSNSQVDSPKTEYFKINKVIKTSGKQILKSQADKIETIPKLSQENLGKLEHEKRSNGADRSNKKSYYQ